MICDRLWHGVVFSSDRCQVRQMTGVAPIFRWRNGGMAENWLWRKWRNRRKAGTQIKPIAQNHHAPLRRVEIPHAPAICGPLIKIT